MGRGSGRSKEKNVLSPLARTLELEKGTESGSTSHNVKSSLHEKQEMEVEEKRVSPAPENEISSSKNQQKNE
ncbi:unnamed protein product [Lathyrus sativus]|nr:unnamed protein product [Lathyrus sativus]